MTPNSTPGRISGRPVRLSLRASTVRGTLASMVRQERADPLALRACALAIGGERDERRALEVVEVTVAPALLEGLLDRVGRLDVLAWLDEGASEATDLVHDGLHAGVVAPLDAIVLARLAADWSVSADVATTAVLWAAGGALMAKRLPGVDVGRALSVARRLYRRHDVPVAALDDLWHLVDQYHDWVGSDAPAMLDKAARAIGRAYAADTGPVVTIRLPIESDRSYGPPYRSARVWPDPNVAGDDDTRLRAAVPERIEAHALVQGAIGWKAARAAAQAVAA